jgi:hypothetical protein
MTRTAHIIDIIVRSFFLFVVFWLLFSYVFRGFFAILLASVGFVAAINFIFEITAGKKYWRKPQENEQKVKRDIKKMFREFFCRAFSRDRTKGFVWAGTIILLMSFVVRLNVYYIVFACAVFIMAAITRFAPPAVCATIKGGDNEDGLRTAPDEAVGEVVGAADKT